MHNLEMQNDRQLLVCTSVSFKKINIMHAHGLWYDQHPEMLRDELLFTVRRQTVLPSTNVRLTHISIINIMTTSTY